MQEPKKIFLDKIDYYRKILDNIQIAINKYKLLNIISNNEYNLCIESIDQVINLINTINFENIVSELEYIQNNISSIIKNYGIMNFDFLISICFDFDFSNKYLTSNIIESKLEIIKKYLHPINYKVINWTSKLNLKNFTNKEVVKNKLLDDKVIVEESNMLECYDLMRITNNFNLRIYGIKVIIHDHSNKKTLSINCIIDNLIVNNNTMHFLVNKKNSLNKYIQEIKLKDNDNFSSVIWDNYLEILSLKDYLIYSNEEIVNKYFHIYNNLILYEQKTINNLVQDFITSDLFNQRQIILNLLLNNEKYEMQYIAYLLYDLLTNDNINNSDSCDQKDLYNSLPIRFKKLFKDAMYKTIEYTTTLSNFDNNKIPIEQQICLMKVNKNVKERAMQKLKEIKSKSEDSGSKARQYLDGLLKIPFSIYKEEDILTRKNDIYKIYISLVNEFKKYDLKTINENEIKDFFILLQDFFGKEVSNNFQIINNIKIIETILMNYILKYWIIFY